MLNKNSYKFNIFFIFFQKNPQLVFVCATSRLAHGQPAKKGHPSGRPSGWPTGGPAGSPSARKNSWNGSASSWRSPGKSVTSVGPKA